MDNLQRGIIGIEQLTSEEIRESHSQGIDFEFLAENGINKKEICVELSDFEEFLVKINYEQNYPSYVEHFKKAYTDLNIDISFVKRKYFEQYLALYLTHPDSHDVVIDIAAAYGPLSVILKSQFNVKKSYHQDIIPLNTKAYPYLNSSDIIEIKGNASNLPVSNGELSYMYLLNSWEHFQAPSDLETLIEGQRCLKKGGKMIIVPLNTARLGYVMTDPAVWETKQVYEENKEPIFRKNIPINVMPCTQVYAQHCDANMLIDFAQKTPHLKYEIVRVSLDIEQWWLPDLAWNVLIAEKNS